MNDFRMFVCLSESVSEMDPKLIKIRTRLKVTNLWTAATVWHTNFTGQIHFNVIERCFSLGLESQN